MNVTVLNTGPTAANDAVTTRHDQPVTASVLGNDHDANGDTLRQRYGAKRSWLR